MNVTLTRENFQKALAATAATIPTRTTLPVLSNALLEADGEALEISATDLDISVSLRVPAEVHEVGAVTVPAKKLSEIARELPEAPVKLRSSGDHLALECGRSRFRLHGLPREEYPTFPQVPFDEAWKVECRLLQRLATHTAFAASTEESRPVLNGVLWQLRPEEMRMVATNGHRLARMSARLAVTGAPQADFIMPPKALVQVDRLFAAEQVVEIARSENHIGFRGPDAQVYTRLLEGPYPNYEQVIPRDNDKILVADREALLSGIRRMAVVASDQTHRIRFSLGGATLRLSVQTPDLGEAEDEVSVQYEGDPLEIGFNASYVAEILRYISTEEVRMTFKAPERAATLEPVGGDDSYLCLVMPLRLLE
ncbi:MAG: DNA polymerase III subunit beta [Gemmatimonadetes bacterium]|nr:DNA polymerase III subunit beta [Gemmatimonadota bacterium]